MGLFDFMRPKVINHYERVHDSDRDRSTRPGTGSGRTKYGNINYIDSKYTDYDMQRANARGVYHDSLIARGLVTRFVDNVINTGLTWESSPLWSQIPAWQNKTDIEKYAWTEKIESRFTLYSKSKEADVKGRLSFSQLQRLLYRLRVIEGEYFCILKYLNGTDRMSPVAVQVLNNDQVQTPYDAIHTEGIKKRGGTVSNGIEYDSTGKMVAIFVRQKSDYSSPLVRVPVFGPKSGRRFVIHDANFESSDQYRGFPELASFIYELDRLTEYDISELEAVVASAAMLAAVEADKDVPRNKKPFAPAGSDLTADSDYDNVKGGVETVQFGKRALWIQNLLPGQKINFFNPTRPNPNYDTFVEAFETRIAGALGMPLSVFRQKFQSSYSAARAEILFFWNNIYRRRDDFVNGFLTQFYEAWFTEEVAAQNISAPGYRTAPVIRHAWLYGSWNGISRPVVDPLKEVNASEKRRKLGDTTGEREAKAHNGSDWRENVNRLKNENELLAEANRVLDPEQFTDPEESDNGGSDEETN